MEASSNQKQSIGGSLYDGKIAGLYDLEETLGSGHFAVVKLARHVFTGAKVAVKVVDKTKLDEVSKAHLFQEVRCMKLVQHPNVVRLYEVIDTQTKLYLVLELGDGGDLYDYIMKHEGGLGENLARKYFKQILRAISYCHQLHVVHRDLKPENVVFFEKLGVVKLTDFGFSNKFSPGQKLQTFCGSLAYSAPEILLGDSYDAPAVDIWSLGVILFMLVCGQPPFEKGNDSETLTMIMDCKYTVPPQISPTCSQLIASMLVRDPKTRATLDAIASHPWLQEGSDSEVLDYLPLVSRHELSEEDHAFILQKMINGNIASKEDILQSLDKNKYNYISATYFLLAEIRLRKRREEQMQKKRSEETKMSEMRKTVSTLKGSMQINQKKNLPISINVMPPNQLISETTKEKRNRKCSIVREEDEEESFNDSTSEVNELKVALTRRESISDGRLNKSVHDRTNKHIPPSLPMTDIKNSINSSEATSVENLFDNDLMKDSKDISEETIKKLKELEIGKLNPLPSGSKNPVLTHRRSKLHKIRTPSCSSSEASDDDSKSKNKKKINKLVGDTPNRLRMHRRDSHDDSSDSQDHPSSAGRTNNQTLITQSTSASNKKEGQTTQAKDQSKHSQPKGGKKNSKDSTSKRMALGFKQSHRRRRIRESQSLDRITEAQEYEIRNRGSSVDNNSEHTYSLANLSMSAAEQNEVFEDDHGSTKKVQSIFSDIKLENLYSINVNPNIIAEGTSISKAIQVTGTKCFVTIKKIRRLGKFFPVVNFS